MCVCRDRDTECVEKKRVRVKIVRGSVCVYSDRDREYVER